MNKREEQEKALVRAAKIIATVSSGVLLFLGLVLIAFADDWAATLRFLFGISALFLGAAKVLGYFSGDLYRIAFQFDLAAGIVVTLFGVLLLSFPEQMLSQLYAVIVIYVLVDGAFRVQTAVDAYRFGLSFWHIMLAGALALVGGATVVLLFITANPSFFAGLLLAADGALGAFVTLYTVRERKRRMPPFAEGQDEK